MQLHNKKHIDEDERRREQQGVEAVQHTAVSGDQIARILDARGAFEHRLHQIAQHARCGRYQRQTEPRPYIGIQYPRRIISYMKVGSPVEQNSVCGFIKFGSRVDVLVPKNSELLVEIGDPVVGSQTPIARLPKA